MIHSMQGVGVVQDTFAGEAVEGEGGYEEMTGGYFLPLRLEILPFLST